MAHGLDPNEPPEPAPAAPWRALDRGVIRIADGVVATPGTPEWAEYVAFLRAGGIPDPMVVAAPGPPPVNYRAAGRAARAREIDNVAASDPVAALVLERNLSR